MFKDWLQKLMNNGTGKVSSTVQNELHNEINHEVLIESEYQHDHDFRLTLTGLEARLHTLIIPALFEPPVRSLRATLPAQQSQTFR